MTEIMPVPRNLYITVLPAGAFRHTFEFVRHHQRPLHHLERLAGVVLAPADGTAHDGAAAQRLGQYIRGGGVWRKPAEDGKLGVVHNDLRALLTVVAFQLAERLDDRHDLKPSASAGGEHHFGRFNLRQ